MRFILNKDTLTIEDVKNLNSGSVNYYEVDVEHDESWNDLVIECVLVKSNKGVSVGVISNKMFIDQELKGWYSVGFVGYKVEDGVKTYQISTNLKSICFDEGAGEIKTQNASVPTLTEWEIYLAQIHEIVTGVKDEIVVEVKNDLQPILDKNVQDMKEYTDKEIATFDFIKIVQELPETGLPNRTYFVAKANTDDNDLYDEYMWVNEKWEPLGTKRIEVDLTNCLKKDEVEEETFEITYEDGTVKTVRSVVFK